MPQLSIIIPSFNEAENLPSLLAALNQIAVENTLDAEVIISDDASQDATLGVASDLQRQYPDLNVRVLHRFEPRRGYGAVVRYGLAHATGRFAVIVAADGQNPIQILPQMMIQAQNGAQLAQCSRYSQPGSDVEVPPVFRAYQALYRGLARVLLGKNLPDITYGFKLFDRVLVTALGLSSNRFSISPEITFKVLLSGGKIAFVPGKQRTRERGVSKFVLHREILGHAYVLLRAWLHRFGFLWF